MSDENLTIHLAITSAPTTPRTPLTLPKSSTTTPSQLRLLASQNTNIPLDKLKLIFKGRLIVEKNDGDVVKDFGLEDGCVVHCVGKPVANASAAPAAAAPAAVASAAATGGASVSIPAAPTTATATSTMESNDLKTALATLATAHSSNPQTHLTALQTLSKLLSNITSHPMEEKYRRVKKSNAAFQRRLGSLDKGHEVMMAVGFKEEKDGEEEMYVMEASAEAWPVLVRNAEVVKGEMESVKRRVDSSGVPPAAAATTPASVPPPMGAGFGGMGGSGFGNSMGGGMGGMGGGGGRLPQNIPPGMQDAVANMMSNPEALRGMLQNPMVRNMMQNDPRFANNPHLQQSLDMMLNDPNMMNQLSQIMSDPNMRAQMNNMMNAQQGMGGSAGGMGAPGGAAGGDAGNMNASMMMQQMQMMQRLSQQMNNSGTAGGATGAQQQPPAQQQQGGTSGQQTGGNSGGNSGGGDQEMTEEEMIAEAIARSLRES